MAETFVEGLQYCATIVGSASGEVDLGALEKTLSDFKSKGIDASLEIAFASNVSIDVYVSLAKMPKRHSPPPITRQTAEAYQNLIQKIRKCGYTHVEEIRDGRTGLGEISDETPIFEVVEINTH